MFLMSVALAVIAKFRVSVGATSYGINCLYYYNSYPQYKLDLRHYGQNAISINATNSEYQYFYSPCNKSYYSSEHSQFFQIIRYDISDFSDVRYLAATPMLPTVVPYQDYLTAQFLYEEENELCPNNTQITYVYWQCNNSLDNYPFYYRVLSSGSLIDCVDTIFIQSPLACATVEVIISNYECIFTDSYDNQLFTLDLTKYPSSISYSGYYYNPCINVLKRYASTRYDWMMLYHQTGSTNPSKEINWAIWNITDVVVPYYSVENNLWTFTYYGLNTECGAFKTVINWGCYCDSTSLHVRMHEDVESCSLVFNVTSIDFCIDECQKNNTNCVYYYEIAPNQYEMLNLSALTGMDIVGVEIGGLNGFVYTPCNNRFVCDGKPVMTFRKDINANKCIEYLAIFNSTHSFYVVYDKDSKYEWVITYTNGESCGDDVIHFTVSWYCSASTDWYVSDISYTECDYQTKIASKFAC